jgi:hypothetical protein
MRFVFSAARDTAPRQVMAAPLPQSRRIELP